MSKIAKRALISSLIASAVVVPAIAQQDAPNRSVPCVAKRADRICGHAADATTGPLSVPAADLLADGVVYGKVLGYLHRAFAACPEEAEDAAQEAVVRAPQKEIRSCCATTFSAWMRRTAHNVLFDLRK